MTLADRDGLASVSMAKVAAELEFTTMSLYRHVGSKDELVTHMHDAALPTPPDDLDTADWRAGLRQWTRAQSAAAVARPWMLDVPVNEPPLMPNSLAWLEAALRIMVNLPLTGMEKLSLLTLLASYARSEAATMINIRKTYAERGIPSENESSVYEQAMLQVTANGRYPLLHEMASDGELLAAPPEISDEAADEYFSSFPVDRILDGVEAFVTRRSSTEPMGGRLSGQD